MRGRVMRGRVWERLTALFPSRRLHTEFGLKGIKDFVFGGKQTSKPKPLAAVRPMGPGRRSRRYCRLVMLVHVLGQHGWLQSGDVS